MSAKVSHSEVNLSSIYRGLVRAIGASQARARTLAYPEAVLRKAQKWLCNLESVLQAWAAEIELNKASVNFSHVNSSYPGRQAHSILLNITRVVDDAEGLVKAIGELLDQVGPYPSRDGSASTTELDSNETHPIGFLEAVSDDLFALQNLVKPITMELAADGISGPYAALKSHIDRIHEASMKSGARPALFSASSLSTDDISEPVDDELRAAMQNADTASPPTFLMQDTTHRKSLNLLQPFGRWIYQPLIDSQIRILRLLPAQSQTEPINCDLQIRWLDASLRQTNGSREPPASEYEALSWCRKGGVMDGKIQIRMAGHPRPLYISEHLEVCLKRLRYNNKDRFLWIDAICIDQDNITERNAQIVQMTQVYEEASQVAVWIGDEGDHSGLAIDFMKNKVSSLSELDTVRLESENQSESWVACQKLMSRPWFSRRWAIHEIASARESTLYCGRDSMKWQDFAGAVSLIAKVPSVTHRLSHVMERRQMEPRWRAFLDEGMDLGAALLVDATTNIFRGTKDGKRSPNLSLEYLVSKFSTFTVSQPRDIIYAFISIAKDTIPIDAGSNVSGATRLKEQLTNVPHIRTSLISWVSQFTKMQLYNIDYGLPVTTIYTDFVKFCVVESVKTDATTALDIICRPWAPTVPLDQKYSRPADEVESIQSFQQAPIDSSGPLPSWVADFDQAPFPIDAHLRPQIGARPYRTNADSLVGLPSTGKRNYCAAGKMAADVKTTNFKRRPKRPTFDRACLDDQTQRVLRSALGLSYTQALSPQGTDEAGLLQSLAERWKKPVLLSAHKAISESTGLLIQNESESENKDMKHTVLVEGFILDDVLEVEEPSSAGDVPYAWTAFGGWDNLHRHPPEPFWRTMVADRDPRGGIAPAWYPRACRAALMELTWTKPNPLKTDRVIEYGGATSVTEFLRRVQAVIWNRRLIRTRHLRRLAMSHRTTRPGDLVCILHGCSVPVILRRVVKSEGQMVSDILEDMREAKALIWRSYNRYKTSERYRQTTNAGLMGRPNAPFFLYRDHMRLFKRRFTLLAEPLQAISQAVRHDYPEAVRDWSVMMLRILVVGGDRDPFSTGITWSGCCRHIGHMCFWFWYARFMCDGSHTWVDKFTLSLLCLSLLVMLSTTELNPVPRFAPQDMARKARAGSKKPGDRRPDPRYYYQLIGECYVHGMMDGEAIDWQANYKVPNEGERERGKIMTFELQ